jgi:hypothetical protein
MKDDFKKESGYTSTAPVYEGPDGKKFTVSGLLFGGQKLPKGKFKVSGPVPKDATQKPSSMKEMLKNPPINASDDEESIVKTSQQASHLLIVSALELMGQERWDARLVNTATSKIEWTGSGSNEEDMKKKVLEAVAGKTVKISESSKNDQPVKLDWGIQYQE